MSRHHEMDESGATSALVRELKSVLKPTFPGPMVLASLYFLSIHMMITFYLLLLVMAALAGEGGKSPSLMAFVVVWHVIALPIWLLRNLMLKLCHNPLGILLCFTIFAGVVVSFHEHLVTGLTNISHWIEAMLNNMLR